MDRREKIECLRAIFESARKLSIEKDETLLGDMQRILAIVGSKLQYLDPEYDIGHPVDFE